MRVAIIMPRGTTFAPARATSIDTCVYDYARTSRHDITVYGAPVDAPFSGVRYVSVGRPKGFSIVPAKLRNAMALARRALDDRPDRILVEQHPESAAVVARVAAPVPVILQRHGLPRAFVPGLRSLRHSIVYNQLAAIAWVADAHHQHFARTFPRLAARSHHVPNGIDLSEWQPVPPSERQRSIVFAGRLTREKGVIELAEALEQFLPSNPDWSATIVAVSTAERADTERRMRQRLDPFGSRVTWLFDQPLTRVREILTRAGIVVVPSIVIEGFNRVAMEAHAAGAAVISSGSGGLREVSGNAAYYLDAVSRDPIVRALENVATPDALTNWQQASRRHALETLDLARVTARLDDVIENAQMLATR